MILGGDEPQRGHTDTATEANSTQPGNEYSTPEGNKDGHHLSELEGGHYHEDETAEAEVEPVSVGQTGVRLPLQQLQHRVDDYHGSPGRRIALHSFKKKTKTQARRCTGRTK